MHGLNASDITWYAGGTDRPGRAMVLAAPHLPPDVTVIQVEDRSLEEMLWAGDLDAVIVPNPPASIASSDRSGDVVRRLFADPRAAERAYWEKTNCLPIMHVVAISRRLLDRAPGIGARLYKALDSARREYFDRLRDPDISRVPLPWISEHLDSLGRDPWPYGVEANRATIECLLRYGRAQGLLADWLEPADLFGEWEAA